MSRSYHQHHKIIRSEKCPSPYIDDAGKISKGRRKMIPYGSQGYCGYGNEVYIKKWHEEMILDVINKRKERRNAKKQIEEELLNNI